MNQTELVEKIVKLLDDKKARDICALDIGALTSVADFFIIATGGSTTQVKALCDHVEEELKKDGMLPTHKEGYNGAAWILLEYSGVVIHIFQAEMREFYNLENLWNDAKRVEVERILS